MFWSKSWHPRMEAPVARPAPLPCPATTATSTMGAPSGRGGRNRMSEEKRTFDRIETEHSIRIIGDDGSSFPAIAANISLTGLQILCDEPTMQRISPHGLETKATHDVQIRVRVMLPEVSANLDKLGLFGRVVSVRAGGQDEYRIGVQFTDFEPGSYNALEHYIDTHL